MDIHHVLAEDAGRACKREVVKGCRDRTLERVLDGDDPVFAFRTVYAVEHIVKRNALFKLRVFQAKARGERVRSFVAVGSGRPKIGDRCGGVRHGVPFAYTVMPLRESAGGE